MAGAVTAQAQLDDAIRTFIAEAAELSEHKGVMKNLFDTRTLPQKQGRTWNEPWFTPISAAALTDGLEFDSPTQITDSKITITPGEVGVQVMWTNRADMTITENFASIAANMCTDALERKRDQDLLGLLDGFSTSLGGATTTFTAGLVSAAVALLQGGRAGSTRTGALTTGDPAPTPYYTVVHPYHGHDLLMQLGGLSGAPTQVTTGAMVGNYAGATLTSDNMAALRNAGKSLGNLRGSEIFVDGNFTITSNSIKAGCFSKMACVHVSFQGVQTYRVRSNDGRAVRHTTWIDYGYGERADNYGIELYLDTTAPAT